MFTRHVNRWKLGALGILAISAVAAGVLASAASPAPNRTAATKITGAGSTFVFPLVSQWIPAVSSALGIDLTYASVGSGAGIAQITARTVDFGASDAPMSPDQFSACKGCVQVPWALAATSIMYNVPGLTKQLKLTGPVIAGIYLGQITTWDAPAIKALNPGLALPSTKITPVYRSDNSGTTLQLHRLPLDGQPDVEGEDRHRRQRELADRCRRQGLVGRGRRDSNTVGADRLRRCRLRAAATSSRSPL